MDSKFKVFYCGFFPTLGDGIAVVTGEEIKGEMITEWFYLIKGKPDRVSGFIIKASNAFPSLEEFWNTVTYMTLKNSLYFDQLWPAVKDKPDSPYYLKEITLKEMDKHVLLSLKAEHPGFIKYISKNTSCSKYKEFEKILKAIIIERHQIPYSDVE